MVIIHCCCCAKHRTNFCPDRRDFDHCFHHPPSHHIESILLDQYLLTHRSPHRAHFCHLHSHILRLRHFTRLESQSIQHPTLLNPRLCGPNLLRTPRSSQQSVSDYIHSHRSSHHHNLHSTHHRLHAAAQTIEGYPVIRAHRLGAGHEPRFPRITPST